MRPSGNRSLRISGACFSSLSPPQTFLIFIGRVSLLVGVRIAAGICPVAREGRVPNGALCAVRRAWQNSDSALRALNLLQIPHAVTPAG